MQRLIISFIENVLYIIGSLYATAGFIIVIIAFPGLPVVNHVLLHMSACVAIYVGFKGFDVTLLEIENLVTACRLATVLTSVFLAVLGMYFLFIAYGTGTNLPEDVVLVQVGILFIAGSVFVIHSDSPRYNA